MALAKYRKIQLELDEANERAEMAEEAIATSRSKENMMKQLQ